jgi:hypothetical protein
LIPIPEPIVGLKSVADALGAPKVVYWPPLRTKPCKAPLASVYVPTTAPLALMPAA